MLPTRRCLILLALLLPVAALPAIVHPATWVVIAAIWLALSAALVLELVVLLPARVSVAAECPATLGVGEELVLSLRIALRSRFHVFSVIRAEVRAPIEQESDITALLSPGSTAHRLPLLANRRGTGRIDAAWFRLEGPLGLIARIERHALDTAVAIIPSTRRVRRFALEHFGASGPRGGAHVHGQFGVGSELDALTPYVHGMDLRSVDWKATARHQALAVRRYRPEKNQRVIVCCDVGRLMGDPIAGLERLDHALHATQLLAYAALSAGDQVGLHAYAAEPVRWLPAVSGMRQLERVAHAAAALHVEDVETNHFLGLRDLLGRLRRRSLVIVMTEFVDATGAEIMIENLVQLAQRHLVVFVALDDPAVEAPFGQAPLTLTDTAAAVIAGSLRDDRRRVLRRLSRAGVDVVHGPPERATLDLVSHYVRIKRRGRIG